MCAIDVSRGAWCWGRNTSGSLGDGSAADHVDPRPVASISGVAKVGTGFDVSCAATASDAVHCWGANDRGQLGIGTAGAQATTPVELPFFGQIQIDQLEVGCGGACVRSGHEIYCWGGNGSGVVDDTLLDAFAPKRVVGLPL